MKGIGCCFERRCFAMRINIIAMEQIGENSRFVGLGSRYNASGCNISACTLNSTAVSTCLRVCRKENFNFGRRKHGSANVAPFGNNMLSLCQPALFFNQKRANLRQRCIRRYIGVNLSRTNCARTIGTVYQHLLYAVMIRQIDIQRSCGARGGIFIGG